MKYEAPSSYSFPKWAVPGKNKKKRGWNMEFPFRISPIEEAKCDLWYGRYIDTSHQKRSGISWGVQDRATPGGFSMGLCFLPWNFQGCHTILQNFQGCKLCFLQNFCDHWSYDTPHNSMIHGSHIVLYDVLYYYFMTIKYLYIYLILFLFNSFHSVSFILFSYLSGWDTYATAWSEQLCLGCW